MAVAAIIPGAKKAYEAQSKTLLEILIIIILVTRKGQTLMPENPHAKKMTQELEGMV